MISILLTSEREVKIKTAKSFFGRVFPSFSLKTMKCNFKTPEQPLGPGIIASARERLAIARMDPSVKNNFDYVIAMENGIIDAGSRMVDVNYTVIWDPRYDCEYYGISKAFDVPSEWHAILREKADYSALIPGADVKVGFMMHQKYPEIFDDPNNWFASMNKFMAVYPGRCGETTVYPDRSEQMAFALKTAWFKLRVSSEIVTYKNFPNDKCPIYEDLNSLWLNASRIRLVMQTIHHEINMYGFVPDIIIGAELRGVPLATSLQLLFTDSNPECKMLYARKPGKLPGRVARQKYKKEYGEDSIEIQTEWFREDSRVLIVDDVIATGGTINAMVKIVLDVGVKPENIQVVLLREIKEHRDAWQAQPELKKVSLVRIILGDGEGWRSD